jgi:glycosyltransferase involved in cell wall biosynthesis
MKILQVNQYCGSKGGTELYLHLVSEELTRRGHEVNLLCDEAEGDGTAAGVQRLKGITPYLLDKDDVLTAGLKDVVRRTDPDLVNLHNIHNSRVIRCLAEMRPTVRYVHDHTLFCPRRRYYVYGASCSRPSSKRCLLYSYVPFLCSGAFSMRPWMTKRHYASFRATLEANKRLRGLAVASNYMRACLLENGFPEDMIELLPYFVDVPPEMLPAGDDVLFIGRLIPEKGVHLLIDAMARMESRFRLVIVGDGPNEYREALARRVLIHRLGSRVQFAGSRPNERLAEFYQSARMVVVPSIWPEPFGIVGVEAMAHGRPVVAFDVGGVGDWLSDGVTGFLVRRGDTDGLADRMKKLFDSPDLSTEMGEKGRDLVKARFNRADHMDRLLKLYRKACG